MNGVLGHLGTHIGSAGPGKPPEDGEMNDMTPDAGFGVRALAVWGRTRYLSVTEALHNIESLRVSGEETCCYFKIWRPE